MKSLLEKSSSVKLGPLGKSGREPLDPPRSMATPVTSRRLRGVCAWAVFLIAGSL
jgi:hypothetical protein